MRERRVTAELLSEARAANLDARRRLHRIVRAVVLRTVADVADQRKVDPVHLAQVAAAILEIPRGEAEANWFQHSRLCQIARRRGHQGVERLIDLAVNRACRWLLPETWIERLIRSLRSGGRAG